MKSFHSDCQKQPLKQGSKYFINMNSHLCKFLGSRSAISNSAWRVTLLTARICFIFCSFTSYFPCMKTSLQNGVTYPPAMFRQVQELQLLASASHKDFLHNWMQVAAASVAGATHVFPALTLTRTDCGSRASNTNRRAAAQGRPHQFHPTPEVRIKLSSQCSQGQIPTKKLDLGNGSGQVFPLLKSEKTDHHFSKFVNFPLLSFTSGTNILFS